MALMIKQRLAHWLQRFGLLRWLFSIAIRLFAPTNYVGVMAAVFNDSGRVLMVKHVFRPDYPWGLPGGWIERGENPVLAIQRELKEELNLTVDVKQILFCEPQGVQKSTTTPRGLGIAYYCRAADDRLLNAESAHSSYEVLQTEWLDPTQITWKLARLHQLAIERGHQEFLLEQNGTR
jgi:8-oxo-dGTP pyrophosphatase MutT (NUDIX family)